MPGKSLHQAMRFWQDEQIWCMISELFIIQLNFYNMVYFHCISLMEGQCFTWVMLNATLNLFLEYCNEKHVTWILLSIGMPPANSIRWINWLCFCSFAGVAAVLYVILLIIARYIKPVQDRTNVPITYRFVNRHPCPVSHHGSLYVCYALIDYSISHM